MKLRQANMGAYCIARSIVPSPGGLADVERALAERGFKSSGQTSNLREVRVGSNQQAIVFAYCSRLSPSAPIETYLVVNSSTQAEAEWTAQALETRLRSRFAAAAPAPPATRGSAITQWAEVRLRRGAGVIPNHAVNEALKDFRWQPVSQGADQCPPRRAESPGALATRNRRPATLLCRRLPGTR